MVIQCTQKLLGQLGVSRKWLAHVGKTEYPEGLFDWYAGTIVLAGEPGVLLMNNLTRYPVAVTGEIRKEAKRPQPSALSDCILEKWKDAIEKSLEAEGIHPDVINVYKAASRTAFLEKASSRELTRRLAHSAKTVCGCEALLRTDRSVQTEISREAARRQVCYCGEYDTPAERMLYALNKMREDAGLFGVSLLDVEVWELKITEGNRQTGAVITVPYNVSFGILQELIRTLFGRPKEECGSFLCGEKEADMRRELREIPFSDGLYKSEVSPFSCRIAASGRYFHRQDRYPRVISLLGEHPGNVSMKEMNKEFEWVMRR